MQLKIEPEHRCSGRTYRIFVTVDGGSSITQIYNNNNPSLRRPPIRGNRYGRAAFGGRDGASMIGLSAFGPPDHTPHRSSDHSAFATTRVGLVSSCFLLSAESQILDPILAGFSAPLLIRVGFLLLFVWFWYCNCFPSPSSLSNPIWKTLPFLFRDVGVLKLCDELMRCMYFLSWAMRISILLDRGCFFFVWKVPIMTWCYHLFSTVYCRYTRGIFGGLL